METSAGRGGGHSPPKLAASRQEVGYHQLATISQPPKLTLLFSTPFIVSEGTAVAVSRIGFGARTFFAAARPLDTPGQRKIVPSFLHHRYLQTVPLLLSPSTTRE